MRFIRSDVSCPSCPMLVLVLSMTLEIASSENGAMSRTVFRSN